MFLLSFIALKIDLFCAESGLAGYLKRDVLVFREIAATISNDSTVESGVFRDECRDVLINNGTPDP